METKVKSERTLSKLSYQIKVIDDGFTSISEAQTAAGFIGARVGKKVVCDANDKTTTLYFIYEIR